MGYIEMVHSYKRYHMGTTEIAANRDVNFSIEKGELAIILGSSGAGKSTVLNILGGMDTNDEGQVIVDGKDISGYTPKQLTAYRRNDVGFVFQFYNLVQNLTAKENVELASEIVKDALDPVQVLMDVLTSLMMLFLLGVFPYNLLWELGGKDDTKVRYKGKKPDPWRGFRIGWMATIPAALLYLALWIVKFMGSGGLYLSIYRILQIPYLPFINAMIGTATDPAKIPVWGLAACAVTLLYIPAVCAVSYRLGFRKFSIKEHLTYQNTSDSVETPDGEI